MKKLFILAVVLCVASIATAGLQLTVDGSAVGSGSDAPAPFTLGISESATTSAYDVSLVLGGTVAVDTSGFTAVATFDFASVIIDETTTAVRISGSQFFGGPVGGQLINGIGVSGLGTITMIDEANNGAVLGIVNVTPEPMTMALLGLGGLFLRRRK
ncbi:MAG: PEP-CTERM sorting domain-containing protein [Planctomycetes bacterium]|nr:PEP-CTERM sorting domain-containing protein [Planctomycetota bacterium]